MAWWWKRQWLLGYRLSRLPMQVIFAYEYLMAILGLSFRRLMLLRWHVKMRLLARDESRRARMGELSQSVQSPLLRETLCR